MIDFAEAWNTCPIGARITVSNGAPRPAALDASLAMKIWRSHNFSGTLAEKQDAAPRRMRFELPPDAAGNVIGYWIIEDGGHGFAAAG